MATLTLKHIGLLIISAVQVFALCNILIGLIGTKKINDRPTPVPKFLGDDSRFPLHYNATVDKIAIMVIDAMRVDFLTKYDMPFLGQLMKESMGCAFVCNVKTPTVTLPRIKALVSGDISSYWDVIQNFYSSQLTQDNFIHRAKQERNKTFVFYGDDTWTKLFPNTFDRSEGVSSFYVTDFTEVDWNVTRNLDHELKLGRSNPWDMMILHYLGLDHIGHVHGLRAPTLIQAKLHEMDAVIRRVYQFLKAQDVDNISLPSYLIVTGDHGMANIGGHGSNSEPEVTTQFIVLSTRQIDTKKCRIGDSNNKLPEVEQVDIATTISLLWGLQIPGASLGKLVPGIISATHDLVAAMYYNAMHLNNWAHPTSSGNADMDDGDSDRFRRLVNDHRRFANEKTVNSSATEDLVKQYQQYLTDLSAKVTSSTIGEQNLPQILIGLALLMACIVPMISTLVSSAVHEVWSSSSRPLLLMHFVAPFIMHFSSSFVEEEHYIRHFLWAACIAFHFFKADGIFDADADEHEEKLLKYPWWKGVSILACMGLHRTASAWNSTGQKWTHLPSISDEFEPEQMAWIVFGVVLPLIAGIQLRRRRHRSWMKSLFFAFALIFVMLVKYWTSTAFFGFHNETLERLAFGVIAVEWVIGRSLFQSWILLTVLVFRFPNIPLVAFELVQLEILNSLSGSLETATDSSNEANKILLYIWFGWTSFYYQGNSNNIATVDVNSGYIGQTSYTPAVVGSLIFCNIFSAPVLQALYYRDQDHERENNCSTDDNRKDKCARTPTLKMYGIILTILAAYNSIVYTLALLVFREHLFIWSVFTPKLLYVVGFSILNFMLLIVYLI